MRQPTTTTRMLHAQERWALVVALRQAGYTYQRTLPTPCNSISEPTRRSITHAGMPAMRCARVTHPRPRG
jgi:hypothetical protein